MRRFLAALVGVLAVLAVPVANVAWWVQHEVLDTQAYAAAVAPLAGDPAVQRAVSTHVVDQVVAAASTQVERRLPQLAPLLEQALVELRPELRRAADDAVRGPQFAQVWAQANQRLHGVLVAVVEQRDTGEVTVQDETVTLDLDPLVDDVLAPVLSALPAPVGDRLDLSVPPYEIRTGERVQALRTYARWADRVADWSLGLATLGIGVAVLLARRRARALAIVGFGAAALLLTSYTVVRFGDTLAPADLSALDRAALNAFYAAVTADLQRRTLLLAGAFAAVGLLAAAAAARSRRLRDPYPRRRADVG